MTWAEVIKDPEFSDLNTTDQNFVRQTWVDANYLPKLKAAGVSDADIEGLRNEAISNYNNGQGYISSFASAAGRGAASTFTSAVQGVGALTGSEAIEQAARDMSTAVTENLTVNPSMEKTNFAGNVLGNVAGFLAPGMAGMRIGRALGAGAELAGGTAAEVAAQTAARAASAQLGGRIASNTTMLASGAGSGAQLADQYGIEGPERMGMVLGNAATEMLSENIFGLGSELNTMSRLAGLGGLGANAARRTGGFLADVGENTVEEIAANVGSNLVTSAFAPEGVQTPGILEGNVEAGAGGAIGGAFFGGINLMRPLPPVAPRPSETIVEGATQRAMAGNDAEAAAEIPGAKLQPTAAPQVPGAAAFDPTLSEQLAPAAGELPPPAGFAETTPLEAFPAALPQGLPAGAAVPGAVPEAFPAAPAETSPPAPTPVTTVPRNTELFPDTTNFGGKLSEDAALQTYEERDGYGLAQYVNPRTGSTDVYIAAFGDNDFIAYTREYDAAGNPTNRFTSKLERRTEKPGVTRSMMEDLQSVLPEGHEYTEDTSVSTDGLKFIASQLDKGYELLRNEDGSLVTTDVAISGESKVNDLPVPVDKDGKFGPISITSGKQFLAVRPKLVEMLRRFDPSLGDGNVRWENGTVFIDLPVLKKTTGAAPTQGATPAAPTTAAQTPPTVGETLVAGRFTGVTEAPPTELFHSGELPEGLNSIDPMRTTGAKQGKRGRDFGGFYAGPAETAAKYKGPKNRLTIAPGARAMRVVARGAIERLSLKDRQDLLDQGVDIISGIDIRGLPESVILNKDVILSVELDTQTAPAAPAAAVPTMTEQAPPVTPQTPAAPPAVASQGATPSDLIDQTGRLTVEGAQSMIEAIQSLGLTTAPFVINSTGVAPGVIAPPAAGSTRPVDGTPTIFLNRERMTLDTPLHETTHLLTPTLLAEQPDLYAAGAALLANSPLRQAIVNRYVTEAGMTMTDEQITEEAMVTGLANNGAEWLRAYAGNAKMTRAIKEFLAKVREWFDKLMYSKGFDPNMSLEQFYKKVNRQMLAGKLQQRATNAPVQAMSLADIEKLKSPTGIPLAAFASKYAKDIKPSDKTLADADRIALEKLNEVNQNPGALLPTATAQGVKEYHTRILIQPDGKTYDPNNLAHADATPEVLAIYEMRQNGSSASMEQQEADRVNQIRQDDLKKLTNYLKGNTDYSPSEAMVMVLAASKYGVRSKKTDDVVTFTAVEITDKNQVMVPVVDGTMVPRLRDKMATGMSMKKALEAAYTDAMDAQVKANRDNKYEGLVKFDQSQKYEDAVALNKACAGTPWCTGASTTTAETHINGGDFYVYFEGGIAQVAFRMDGSNKLAEPPRGNYENQALNERQAEIADKILRGGEIPGGQGFLSDRDFINKVKNDIAGMTDDEVFMGMFAKRKVANGYGHDADQFPKSIKTALEDQFDLRDLRAKGYYTDREGYPTTAVAVYGMSGEYGLFPNLRLVANGIANSDSSLLLPALTTVGGGVSQNSGDLNMPVLTTVGESVYGNKGDLNMPVLTTVGGDVYLNKGDLNMPLLTTVGESVAYNSSDLNMPLLTTVGGGVSGNEGGINMPLLTTVGGGVSSNTGDVNMPLLESGPIVTGKYAEQTGASQAPATRFSLAPVTDEDTGAYHFGDGGVGADTTLRRMSGGRSTGHFGTGTYFLGNKQKANSRSARPMLNIDLRGKKLAKPSDPQNLHDGLRIINREIIQGNPLSFANASDEGRKARGKINLELGLSKHTEKEIQSAIEKVEAMFRENRNDGFRTPSTYLMQELGYDGIDVRGTELDNGDYGSVLYPQAVETPTAPDLVKVYRGKVTKPASPDIRFSLAPAVTKPSNVARNQAGTRVRVLMENQTYEGQTIPDAIEQAIPLYDENVDKGFTVAQHMAFIQDLRTNVGRKYQDMTFGAYAGMYSRDLLNESTNPERDPMARELAERESKRVGAMVAVEAATGGRQAKAFDIYNNIANNPAMMVMHYEQLLPFDGKQNVKNDFDEAATTAREEMEGLANEAINTAPEDAMTSAINQQVAAVAKGEETSNVGEVVLDEVKPAETEEDLPEWFRKGQELLGAELSGKIDDLTELLQVYAYLRRKDGTYSLTPEERSANVAARIKKIEESGKTLEQSLAETKKSIDEILSAFNKPKAKAKPKAAPVPKEAPPEGEIQDIVAARINRLLDKIVKPSTSPAKTRTDKEVLVDAIVSTMMAKAGLPADLKAGGDNVTLAFGLVVANPELAAQSVQAVYDLLQSDPASANITSSDKIRGFMQMMTGQSFADGKAYGEKQLNTVLKNELKRLKISVNDVAMDAALTGKTVEQLEAALRDPSRELSKVLSADALNKVVAAVTGEFRKTAAQRAAYLQQEKATNRVRSDMAADRRMELQNAKDEEKSAKAAAERAKKAVLDTMAAYKKDQDNKVKKASESVRKAMAEELRILRKTALDTMSAYKKAQDKLDAQAQQEATQRVRSDMAADRKKAAQFAKKQVSDAKAAADRAKKAVLDAMAAYKKDQDNKVKKASESVRKAMAEELRILRKKALDTMAAYKKAQDKLAMEAQRQTRDAMAAEERSMRKDREYRLALNRKARKAMRRKLAKRGGFMIPLDQTEAEELLDQKPKTVLQYLAREYGFSLTDIIGMAREQDRQATLEAKVGKLAQALGLTKEQADKFMGPVIAEGMKHISEARKKDVSQRINRVLTPVIGKKKTQKTEAEKLIKLAEMGGLTADNVEKLLLNSKNAKEFTPEFRQELIDLIAQANDPHLTQVSRDALKGKFLDKIKAARGITVLSLLGEWTMSNIFNSILSTFKVNFVWGFIKAASDSGVFITISGPAAARADAIDKGVTPAPRLAVAKVLFRQWLRGYSVNMQHNAAFMWSEGLGKDESDMTSQFANTGMEILSRVKDAQIQWSNDGKVLPKSAQKVIKAMAAYGKYTRRIMVASDFINRTSAFEMSKVLEAVKIMQARGGAASTATIQRELDDALYGGNFKDAFAKANKQADDEIAEKKLGKAERGIRVGEIMDEMLGKNLGLTEKQTQEYLLGGRENAKRWSLANQTEGIFGEISNLMLAATRKIPALKFALPAIRMPIAAFSQTLDWTPYGFLRLYAIDKNKNETESFTNYLFNRNGEYGNWNKPVGGVPAYRKTDLMAKATIGSLIMIGLCIKAALSFDEDEDKASFYITGLGPSDPAENKAWREKGNAPFTFRFNGGPGFRFQEAFAYGMLAPIAAWSDAHRYGKPGEAESDRIAYAMGKTLAGFQEAVVMKNLSDILAGGSSYSADGQLRNWSKATSRLASNVLMPRLGGEINTILYGPQDQKALGWGGRALANVPFVPSFNNKPAQDFLGREIHTKREGMLGEIYPALAHRVLAPSLDDPILNFVAKMSPNFLATTRRFKDGTRVMDNYEFVRKWNAAAGVKIREYLTPERMASYERKLAKDKPDAQTEFNVEINKIRTAALRKFSEVQF